MRRYIAVFALGVAGITLCANVLPARALGRLDGHIPSKLVVHDRAKGSVSSIFAGAIDYPVGIISASEPSGMAPPGNTSLTGFSLSYINDFFGGSLPDSWYVFTGVPGGDPDGQFAASHVTVNGGLLHLNTARDTNYRNKWVTGGVCQCGLAQTYGAYFVRSRITAAGPNEAQVLWPKKGWPPEIDFNETGASASSTSSTVHFGANDQMSHRYIAINLTMWHTWGVIWTPSSVTYVVDGHAWGQVSNFREIPRLPMTLDFEQRTSCHPVRNCPTRPATMLIDWVAEYTIN